MNKKFSTLLTTTLFMGGALFSEAYAENLQDFLGEKATKVESGSTYFLVEKTSTPLAIGMTSYSAENDAVKLDACYVTNTFSNEDVAAYTWVVTETTNGLNNQTTVTFKNVKTDKYLYVTDDGTQLVTDFKTANAAKTKYSNLWVWSNIATYEAAAESGTTNLLAGKAAVKGIYYGLHWDNTVQVSNTTFSNFELYKAADQEVSDDELNKLYNSAGFNFKIKDGVDNIFADQRIKAIKLDGNVTDGDPDFGFPAGTYFVTETPAGSYAQATDKYDYLLNSTFIALSASDNASTSADKQKKGEGFTLTTVKGKDLNLFIATDKDVIASTPAEQQTSGSTISVLNAAFTVKTNVVNNKDKYALSLDRVRIQEAAGNAKHVYKENIIIDIKSDASYNSDEVLVSYPSTTQSFIFEFVASNVVEGKEFLNENGAAIYNIQFVGGDADGLYLTSAYDEATSTTGFENFAKGIAIADLEAPAFQYVVTKVEGNNVTFTNRETGADFTAQLFKEEGDDTYSLAVTTGTFDILTIQNNGDVKETKSGEKLNLAWVKLTPATVDKFAGFLNVEDETKMTLTFARDLDPTSNKLYPVVTETSNVFELDNAKLTDKVEEAAQWQLIKSEKPSYKTYTYAYIDADDKVAYKTLGDTVAYYTYNFEYVNDGLATGKYLASKNSTDYKLDDEANALDFVIFENADGSHNVKASYTSPFAMTTSQPNVKGWMVRTSINQEIAATDIKTYLVQDAPEISLPADASYVTLKSEKGNYIAMDGDRDGIVVNSDPITFRVLATDLKNVVPSFYVTTGWNEEDHSRMFLFNPEDSVNYYVGEGKYDKEYQWDEETTKAIFKSGSLNASLDTLTTTIKGNKVKVAMKADNAGVQGGLDYFKYQIILANADDADDLYIIRTLADAEERYLCNINDKLTWTSNRKMALKFYVEDVDAPTANESINAANNVVVAGVNGAVVVKGAEGKNVIVSTILGKVVANEVVSSDNATIAAPAGVVVVSVDGESFKVVVK